MKAGPRTLLLVDLQYDFMPGGALAVRLVEDGCRPVELQPGDAARALERMREAGVRMTRSDRALRGAGGGSRGSG